MLWNEARSWVPKPLQLVMLMTCLIEKCTAMRPPEALPGSDQQSIYAYLQDRSVDQGLGSAFGCQPSFVTQPCRSKAANGADQAAAMVDAVLPSLPLSPPNMRRRSIMDAMLVKTSDGRGQDGSLLLPRSPEWPHDGPSMHYGPIIEVDAWPLEFPPLCRPMTPQGAAADGPVETTFIALTPDYFVRSANCSSTNASTCMDSNPSPITKGLCNKNWRDYVKETGPARHMQQLCDKDARCILLQQPMPWTPYDRSLVFKSFQFVDVLEAGAKNPNAVVIYRQRAGEHEAGLDVEAHKRDHHHAGYAPIEIDRRRLGAGLWRWANCTDFPPGGLYVPHGDTLRPFVPAAPSLVTSTFSEVLCEPSSSSTAIPALPFPTIVTTSVDARVTVSAIMTSVVTVSVTMQQRATEIHVQPMPVTTVQLLSLTNFQLLTMFQDKSLTLTVSQAVPMLPLTLTSLLLLPSLTPSPSVLSVSSIHTVTAATTPPPLALAPHTTIKFSVLPRIPVTLHHNPLLGDPDVRRPASPAPVDAKQVPRLRVRVVPLPALP